ncbi:MAG TPA: hypothetical protein VES20_11425, partial [Bryobacteraceae bacterium]|nr:hypothetical protein [Bryobacteraceae bacterium]
MPRILSSSGDGSLNWSHVYVGMALTTLATLVLELSLTRIFSVVFYYHFAFLAISIALFGLGAGGVLSYLVPLRGAALFRRLGSLAIAISVTVVLALVFLLTRGEPDTATIAVIYFVTAAPFVLAGMVVSLVISETIDRVDRVYFFDLLGAAGGCLVLVPFLNVFGGPNTVVVAAILFAASAAIWFNLGGSSIGRAAGVVVALALVSLATVNMRWPMLDVTFAKGQKLANEVWVKWNSFSRIALAPEKSSDMVLIVIDADASTGIAKFDFDKLTERDRRDLTLQGPGF